MDKKTAMALSILLTVISALCIIAWVDDLVSIDDRLGPSISAGGLIVIVIGLITLFFSHPIANVKNQNKPAIASYIVFLLAATIASTQQTGIPFVTITCIANVYIFHEKPHLALILAVPGTIFYIAQSTHLLSDGTLNSLVYTALVLAPLIITDLIIVFLVAKTVKRRRKREQLDDKHNS